MSYLIADLERSWVEVLPHAPESDLDAWLVDCNVEAAAQSYYGGHLFEAHSFDVDGVAVPGEAWSYVRKGLSGQIIHMHGHLMGIGCMLIIFADEDGFGFDCECVYGEKGQAMSEVDPSALHVRVSQWCRAVVQLGASFGAARVEVEGRRDEHPIVLWSRA